MSVRVTVKRWSSAVEMAPRLLGSAVGRALLPAGPAAISTLRSEGTSELHWKVLGDALARFFGHSGPVLTKLGQILATRSDLLPEAVCLRLEALYTGQVAMSPAQLERMLARCYGRKRPFRRFERKPMAVGSVGQVHRARLRDGTRVVVKLVRPGVARRIAGDVRAVRALSGLLLARQPDSTRELVFRALDELGRALEAETDLKREASAYEEFRSRLRKNARVRVPHCYPEISSDEVLVMEELRGEPLSSLRRRAKSDPAAAKRAASLALREILSQVFEEGRFHGDPHGGNLLLLEDGRLGLIDLGLTGELRPEDRRNVGRAVRAFLRRDVDAAIDALLAFGTLGAGFDRDAFAADVGRVFRERAAGAMAQARGEAGQVSADPSRLEALVDEILRVARRHGVDLPSETLVLVKTLVTIEGVARALDPELDVVVTALPILLRSLAPSWLRWRPWPSAR
jgi:ubiquinone biosynthesis protein